MLRLLLSDPRTRWLTIGMIIGVAMTVALGMFAPGWAGFEVVQYPQTTGDTIPV